MGWDAIFEILNKFIPSRKGALVDEINNLTVKYQKALEEGRDTEAAQLHKRLQELRKKAEFTGGDV
jgi:hypothetical protein